VESGDAPNSESARHILVVDDEPQVLRVVTRVLDGLGFQVTTVDAAAGAVSLLEKDAFDAILTDVVMPGMSGIELLRTIRERDLDIPVVLMTGGPDVQSAAQAVGYGAFGYIAKPFEPGELRKLIQRAAGLGGIARAKRESIRALETGRPEAGDRAGLEVTLERALGSMWMAYQPIVDPATRAVFGYEALLRSTELALPNPGAVLEAAQRLGRTHDVGRTVRQRVSESVDLAPKDLLFFVNLLARDLEDESLVGPAAAFSHLAPRIVLEITERSSLDEIPEARNMIERLRGLGFRIAIDDLGAGYAGLNSFAVLEPDFVKLDMSLIRDVDRSPVKQKLIKSMSHLCRDMGVRVVAEGIETTQERDTVIELGCDLLQGYLLARPGKPFPAIERWP
jgi:EAL domain-containing protein (putative c-di-GMP-specific phosphodiesterase class I)/CheY-like chemotaxis protein